MAGSTNSTIPPDLAELLYLEASLGLPNLQTQIAAVVLLIWDIMITLDQEVEYIWKAPASVIKYVYFFVRYTALSQGIITIVLLGGDFNTTHNICRLYAWYYALNGILLLSGVDIILIYRAFAFYQRDRRVLVGLIILWVVNTTATLILSVMTSIKFPITHTLTFFKPGVLGECSATSFPYLLHDIWISELCFQTILFLLVLGRFIQITILPWNRTVGMSNLYLVFIRDGIWAYFLLFGLFIGCAVWNEITILSWIQWVFVFTEVAGSRLVLNLRTLYPPPDDSLQADISTMSSWRIAPLPNWAGKGVLFDTIHEPELEPEAPYQHIAPQRRHTQLSTGDSIELRDIS